MRHFATYKSLSLCITYQLNQQIKVTASFYFNSYFLIISLFVVHFLDSALSECSSAKQSFHKKTNHIIILDVLLKQCRKQKNISIKVIFGWVYTYVQNIFVMLSHGRSYIKNFWSITFRSNDNVVLPINRKKNVGKKISSMANISKIIIFNFVIRNCCLRHISV